MMIRFSHLLTFVVVLVLTPVVRAADHLDGPRASADPAADLTDVYAWMSEDAGKLYLVMDVFPKATKESKFSDKVQYVFHVRAIPKYGDGTNPTSTNIICTFDAAQKISCWAGDEYVTGDASAAAGIASSSGKLKVFAGLRDDPFFFSLDSFNKTVETVVKAAPGLTFDLANCPKLDAATSAALVTQLKTAADGSGKPAVDFFDKLNVLSIVVAVDRSVVTKGNLVFAVNGATHKAQ